MTSISRGIVSISIEGDNYTVRNTRTGEELFTNVLSDAPGEVPSPATNYQFQPLGVPGGATWDEALGINSHGTEIAGQFSTSSASYGLLLTPNGVQAIGYPGASTTFMFGVNNSGTAVGAFTLNGSVGYGLIGKKGDFSVIGPNDADTTLLGINDAGDFVGTTVPAGTHEVRGFLFVGGVRTDISYPGAIASQPSGINESGEIVGTYWAGNGGIFGFTYLNGSYQPFWVPGSIATIGSGINDSGEIVGSYYDSSAFLHGFVFSQGQFVTIDFPGAYETQTVGVSNSGAIAGDYVFCQLSQMECGYFATPQ